MMPTTRLDGVVENMAKIRISLDRLASYDGKNMSQSQVESFMKILVESSESSVNKLGAFQKKIKDFLRRV